MDEGLAGGMGALARLTDTARGGGLTEAAALASLTTACCLAADLERGELALIEAARGQRRDLVPDRCRDGHPQPASGVVRSRQRRL